MSYKSVLEWPVIDVELQHEPTPSLRKLIGEEFREFCAITPEKNRPFGWDVSFPIIAPKSAALHLKDAKVRETYKPYEVPEVLPTFANLKSDDEFVAFCNKYGLTAPFGQVRGAYAADDGDVLIRPLYSDYAYAFEALEDMQSHHAFVLNILDLHFDAQEQHRSSREYVHSLLGSPSTSLLDYMLGEVNARLSVLHPQVTYDENVPEVVFPAHSLLEVLLLQCLEVIVGTRELRRCANYYCKKFYAPAGKQKYCDYLCGGRARARAAYVRRRHLVPFVKSSAGSWKQKLEEWNRDFPDAAYEDESGLINDYEKLKREKKD
ncbi:MAG: hypothetical protein HPY75_03225 [Actinobacteria bacterium]|nr:hypothetical protein [Actinomycetota bacterium]